MIIIFWKTVTLEEVFDYVNKPIIEKFIFVTFVK